jgi:hypothetical protein
MIESLMNNELESMWKEAVMRGRVKVLSQNLPGGLSKTKKYLSQDSRDLNPGAPEYKAVLLATSPRSSVSGLSLLLLVVVVVDD